VTDWLRIHLPYFFTDGFIFQQVMLASAATHVSKQCQVAHTAMVELDRACELFERAANYGGRAVKFLVSISTACLLNQLCSASGTILLTVQYSSL